MRRKSYIVFAVLIVLLACQSCKSRPEQTLLQSYFHAISLNDVTTMSTMALEPVKIEAESWKITKVSEEKIDPATLPELNQKEADFKKQVDNHIPVTLDAKDAWDAAKDEFNSARTPAAKTAAKAKMDAAQKKYDDEYKLHQDLQKQYNDTKAAAAKEEEITAFSLRAGQVANIRDLKGEVHSKEVEVGAKAKDGSVKNYRITMEMYVLKDEAANLTRRGQWVIIKIEQI
jgi:hypothetical protein